VTTTADPWAYAWWLMSRAAGVTAFALASVAVLMGLMMAGRWARRPGAGRALFVAHQHAALGALIAIAVHALTLLADPWLHPGVAGVAVPLAIAYRPAATALGIVAGYGAALLGLTYYARRWIGRRRWRQAHRATIVVWALGAGHALTAGSDASTPWMRAILLAMAAPIAALFLARVLGARRPVRRPRQTTDAGTAPAG